MRRFHFTHSAMHLALVLLLSSVADAGTKEQMHAEMRTLAQEMKTLKPNLVNPSVKLQYDAKLARYSLLSQQLGGDDPGQVGVSPAASNSALSARPSIERHTRAVAGAPPPSCSATTNSFTQSTPTAIPTGPAVVTSTVVVSGAGPLPLGS